MNCISSIPSLYAPDQHSADFLMVPARTCGHLWQEITTQLGENDNCFIEIAKRVAYLLAFVVLAPFATLLGLLSLAFKSCTPLAIEPPPIVTLAVEESSLSSIERVKNKFKKLIDQVGDTFIPQHVVYDETGNILAFGKARFEKARNESGISEMLNPKSILFVARAEDAEMTRFEAFDAYEFAAYEKGENHPAVFNIKAYKNRGKPTLLTAQFCDWQDYWGSRFPLPMTATINDNPGHKMPYAEMKAIAEKNYHSEIKRYFPTIPGLVNLIVGYLSIFEQTHQSRINNLTTTFIDKTGGAVRIGRRPRRGSPHEAVHIGRGPSLCMEHKGNVSILSTYWRSHSSAPARKLFGYCEQCHPSLEITAEFTDIPGIIKVSHRNKDSQEGAHSIAIDLAPHWLNETDVIPEPVVHLFCPNKDPLSRANAIAKLRSFIVGCNDFEPNPTRTAFFVSRLGIMVIHGTKRSTQAVTSYYLLGEMTQFEPFNTAMMFNEDPALQALPTPPFTLHNRQGNCHLDGEKAEMLTLKEISETEG